MVNGNSVTLMLGLADHNIVSVAVNSVFSFRPLQNYSLGKI